MEKREGEREDREGGRAGAMGTRGRGEHGGMEQAGCDEQESWFRARKEEEQEVGEHGFAQKGRGTS